MEVRPEDLTAQTDRKEDSRQLRRRFTGAGVALIVAFLAVVSATYAWYIYNTGRHTTKVRIPETSDPGKKKEQERLRHGLNDCDSQSKDEFHPANAKYPEWLIKNELPLYYFFLNYY